VSMTCTSREIWGHEVLLSYTPGIYFICVFIYKSVVIFWLASFEKLIKQHIIKMTRANMSASDHDTFVYKKGV
jgi:hypothetical protein